jgi:hypothetical protein
VLLALGWFALGSPIHAEIGPGTPILATMSPHAALLAFESPFPFSQDQQPSGPTRAVLPSRQEPQANGRLRIGASLGIFPFVGRLKYSFIYHGELLDAHEGATKPRPSVSIFADAQATRFLYVGLAVQFITIKWTQEQGVLYDSSAYEFDFLPRLGLSLPASSRFRLLVSAAPGYSVVDVSDVVLGTYVQPSPLRGFVFQADAGVLFLFTQHGFVQASVRFHWALASRTLTSTTTNLPASAELRSTFLGLDTGIGYWF